MGNSFPLLPAISALTTVMEDWPVTARGTGNYISVLKTASTRLKKKTKKKTPPHNTKKPQPQTKRPQIQTTPELYSNPRSLVLFVG